MKVPLKTRIALALHGRGPRSYHDVMHEVFPRESYPRAFRYKTEGGPPGCAMAFGRALREMGLSESRTSAGRGTLSEVGVDLSSYLPR